MTKFEFRTQLLGKASYWVRADGDHLGEVILRDDDVWEGRLGFTIHVELGKFPDREAAAEALLKAKNRYRSFELFDPEPSMTVEQLLSLLNAGHVPPDAVLTPSDWDGGNVTIEWMVDA